MAGIVSFDRTDSMVQVSQTSTSKPIGETRVLFNREPYNVPIYSRSNLGSRVNGSAIIIEESTTILVPDSWSIEPVRGNHLVMERH